MSIPTSTDIEVPYICHYMVKKVILQKTGNRDKLNEHEYFSF